MTQEPRPVHIVDDVPELATEAVSRRRDLWRLGNHRLLCGDARNEADLRRLMGRASAAMVFTDPPYNVRISSVQGRGRIRHREFVVASGELSRAEFIQFLVDALTLAAEYSANGAIHFVFMDWRHAQEILAAGEKVYSEHKNTIVWVKTTPGQGTFLSCSHRRVKACELTTARLNQVPTLFSTKFGSLTRSVVFAASTKVNTDGSSTFFTPAGFPRTGQIL